MTGQLGSWAALLASLALAATLALSHALLRSAALLDVGRWEFPYLWRIGAALALYGAVFASYAWLLRLFELSLLYPLYTGLSVVLVFATGIVFFSEAVSLPKIAGVVLVIVGVGLISVKA